jgi:hypothetical protein
VKRGAGVLAGNELDLSGLHVAGGHLANGAGEVVALRGVNRSSWEYACFDGSGQTHDGPADQSEVTALQSWHITAVRVVLNEDCWLGINGVTVGGAAYQAAVAAYVNLLTQNNIAAIVNLHFSAPGTLLAGSYSGGDQFPMPDRDHSPAFWSSVAATFKGNSRVLFEPFNEPFPDDNAGGDTQAAWQCWRDGGSCPAVAGFPDYTNAGMQELVTAIRAVGATNVIILTGTDWGSQLDQWRQYAPHDSLNPPQLAAGWHSYGDGLSCQTPSCWSTTLGSVVAQAPIVATEIGEFDCQHSYIDQVMGYLDSVQQSYIAWAWGPYNCKQDPALISDWAGTPTQSFGQGFHDHLVALPGGALSGPVASPTATSAPPTATPAPVKTPSPSPTKSPTQTRSPSATATAGATRAPTSTPSKTATPKATVVSSGGATIFADSLASGWSDCSWDATVNTANTAPVYQGSRSIAYTATAAWAGLQICSASPIAASATAVTFAAYASSAGQSYRIWLANAKGNQQGHALLLTKYGGQPAQGTWKVYTIPLADFGVGTKPVYGVTIEEALGQAQPTLFIDNVSFK